MMERAPDTRVVNCIVYIHGLFVENKTRLHVWITHFVHRNYNRRAIFFILSFYRW